MGWSSVFGERDNKITPSSLAVLQIPDTKCEAVQPNTSRRVHTAAFLAPAEFAEIYAAMHRYKDAETCYAVAMNSGTYDGVLHCSVERALCTIKAKLLPSETPPCLINIIANKDRQCPPEDKAALHVALAISLLTREWDVERALTNFTSAVELLQEGHGLSQRLEVPWGGLWLTQVLDGHVDDAVSGSRLHAITYGIDEVHAQLDNWQHCLVRASSALGIRDILQGAQRFLVAAVSGNTVPAEDAHISLTRALLYKGSIREAEAHLHFLLDKGTLMNAAIIPTLQMEVELLTQAPVVLTNMKEACFLQSKLMDVLDVERCRTDIFGSIPNPTHVGVRGLFLLAYQGLNNMQVLMKAAYLLDCASGGLLSHHSQHLRDPDLDRHYNPPGVSREGRSVISGSVSPGRQKDGTQERHLEHLDTSFSHPEETSRSENSPLPASPLNTLGGDGVDSGRVGQIRLGFLSSHFRWHSVGRLMVGIVEGLCHNPRFNVFVIHTGHMGETGSEDPVWARLTGANASMVLLPRNLPGAYLTLTDLELDVLVFCDVGMEALSSFIAHGRYAPVQITFWGHPYTTGLGTMDYFITSDLFEPNTAPDKETQGQGSSCNSSPNPNPNPNLGVGLAGSTSVGNRQVEFREQLVRLEGITTVFDDPVQTYKDPAEGNGSWGMGYVSKADENGDDRSLSATHLFVCAQSLMKLHPEFDYALAGVLLADPQAQVVFLRDPGQLIWHSRFQKRFKRVLQASQDNSNSSSNNVASSVSPSATYAAPGHATLWERVHFASPMSAKEFYKLQCRADVVLDPFPFGGGITTLEALACGTPVVTAPTLQNVHRLASGMLQVVAATVSGQGLGLGLGAGQAKGKTEAWHGYGNDSLLTESLIATSLDDYVRKAIAIAQSGVLRERVRDQLQLGRKGLFMDRTVLEDWERFLKRVVGGP